MRRNVVFGRGRGLRPEDDRYRSVHLGPGRGARIGEYAPPEASEYSDSYYAPAEAAERHGLASSNRLSDAGGAPGASAPRVGGVVGNPPPARPSSSSRAGSGSHGSKGSYGELHAGERSWADIGGSSVHGGESGITEQRASHRGRGPKGYLRSDARLHELVCERLTDDPWIDASDIIVQVEDGGITLSGTVRYRRDKRYAEDIAAACAPDAHILNRLRARTHEHLPLSRK